MEKLSLLCQLVENQDILSSEAKQMVENMMSGTYSPAETSALLTALRMKGETPDEIYGCVQAMRSHMKTIKETPNAVDTCGTGGDGIGTFNISTAVAFVVAGCGVPVIKHGNKAASSKCGSADVLQELGTNIMLEQKKAEEVLKKTGMVFLFAPLYHESMKNVAMVRKDIGIRTVFNFLGPFSNPASVKRQLVGVPDKSIADKLAHVAKQLGYEHLMIVSNGEGLDEIGLSSPTHVYEVKGDDVNEFIINPQKLGFSSVPLERIKGGTAQENAAAIKNILKGKKGPKRDIVVLNAAYVLFVSGTVDDVQEGIKRAEKSLDEGTAWRVLDNLIKESR